MSKHATIHRAREGGWGAYGVPRDITKDNVMCLPTSGAFTEKKTLGAQIAGHEDSIYSTPYDVPMSIFPKQTSKISLKGSFGHAGQANSGDKMTIEDLNPYIEDENVSFAACTALCTRNIT